MKCDTKIQFQKLPAAYALIERLNDPWMRPYICYQHQCIHVGHLPYRRVYDTWALAIEAACNVLRDRVEFRRMQIRRTPAGWVLTPTREPRHQVSALTHRIPAEKLERWNERQP